MKIKLIESLSGHGFSFDIGAEVEAGNELSEDDCKRLVERGMAADISIKKKARKK